MISLYLHEYMQDTAWVCIPTSLCLLSNIFFPGVKTSEMIDHAAIENQLPNRSVSRCDLVISFVNFGLLLISGQIKSGYVQLYLCYTDTHV